MQGARQSGGRQTSAGRATRGGVVALALDPPKVIVAHLMEPGLVTLAKILATLLVAMGTIPLLFMFAPGDRSEPQDRLDSEHKG